MKNIVKTELEKKALIAGLLLWIFGDLVTTYIALGMGYTEHNLITQNLLHITVMKVIAASAIVSIISYQSSRGWSGMDKLKYVPASALIFFGLATTIGNSLVIAGLI